MDAKKVLSDMAIAMAVSSVDQATHEKADYCKAVVDAYKELYNTLYKNHLSEIEYYLSILH